MRGDSDPQPSALEGVTLEFGTDRERFPGFWVLGSPMKVDRTFATSTIAVIPSFMLMGKYSPESINSIDGIRIGAGSSSPERNGHRIRRLI